MVRRNSCLSLLLTALALAVITLVSQIESAQAQVPCPPGFHFEPMSGVGCVQDKCPTSGNMHYGSTQRCICNDGYYGCGKPIDPGFDTTLCGPHCPIGELVACVTSPNQCPAGTTPDSDPTGGVSLSPAQPAQPVPETEAQKPEPDSSDENTGEDAVEITADELIKNLEEFLAGSDNPDLNSRDAAVAAAATAALLASWIAAQLAAGIKLDKIMEAVNLQQDRSIEAAQKTAEQGQKDAAVVDKDAVEGKDMGTSKVTDTPELDLRETRLRELVSQFLEKEKMHRVELEKAKKDLKATAEQVKLLDAQFNAVNWTRFTDASVEIADTLRVVGVDLSTLWQSDTLEKILKEFVHADKYKDFVYKKFQSDVRIAYGWDFLKNLLKTAAAKAIAEDYNLKLKDVIELGRKPFGVKKMPGGASKEVIIQGLKLVPGVGKVVGKGYDYVEQVYGGMSEYHEHTKTLRSLLQQYKQQLEKQLKLEDQVHTHQVEGDFAHRRRVTVLQSLGEHLQKKGNTPGIRTR